MVVEKISASKMPVNHSILIWTLGLLLFVSSIVAHFTENLDVYRFLRGFVSFSYLVLVFILKRTRVNRFIVVFLTLYVLSSVMTIWYEETYFAITSLGLNAIAFTVLVFGLLNKVSFKNIGFGLFTVFSILVLVNLYLLYEFFVLLKNFAQGNVHYLCMLLGAISMVVTGLFTLLFNHANSSKASLFFTMAVFSIIFAEIFRAIAYYDFGYGDASVYIARFLLIIGTIFLVIYSLLPKTYNEELGGATTV